MTESVFYNLASHEGVDAIERLRELGHAVGLHAVHPNVELDERFDPVVSWHNPKAEYMSATIPGAINVYAEPYFDRANVPLGLEPELALRLPSRGAPRRGLPWLQILVHPEIWVYEGATMGSDDARDAERGEGAPTRAARRRRHRPRVTRPLRVVHCPVNTAGRAVGERPGAAPPRRRRAARRLQPLHAPLGGRLVARAARRLRPASSSRSGRRSRGSSRSTDVFHFYFGLTLVPQSVQFPILARSARSR